MSCIENRGAEYGSIESTCIFEIHLYPVFSARKKKKKK